MNHGLQLVLLTIWNDCPPFALHLTFNFIFKKIPFMLDGNQNNSSAHSSQYTEGRLISKWNKANWNNKFKIKQAASVFHNNEVGQPSLCTKKNIIFPVETIESGKKDKKVFLEQGYESILSIPASIHLRWRDSPTSFTIALPA